MERMKEWVWGGLTVPFDIGEVEWIGKLCRAIGLVREGIENGTPTPGSESDNEDRLNGLTGQAESAYGWIRAFFEALFGAEEAGRILGEGRDLGRASEAYADFMAFAAAQLDAIGEAREEAGRRYASLAAGLPQ